MPKFKVHVSWTMCDTLQIEAEDEAHAIEQAEDADLTEGEYLDSSFEINSVEVEEA